MNRKSRGTSRSQSTPILRNRRKVVRHAGYQSMSLLEIVIIAFLGSLVVLMCGIFIFHLSRMNSPETMSSTNTADAKTPAVPKVQNDLSFNFAEHLKAKTFKAKTSKAKKPKAKTPKANAVKAKVIEVDEPQIAKRKEAVNAVDESKAHLSPRLPILPAFPKIPNSKHLIDDTLQGKPTISGIVALLQHFVSEFHNLNKVLSHETSPPQKIIRKVFKLIEEILLPFDAAYRGRPIFPVREDESIFMSLASFREHLLKETLVSVFSNAKYPDKIFIGAVVQNCFGRVDDDGTIHTEEKPCRTGFEVIGKNAQGRDQVRVSNAPPDKNGIEDFCVLPKFKKYCDSGQIRVMYVHEPEAVGPAMARYYASKLWGGETYFIQTDSHLQFAEHWDEKYIKEVKLTSTYPKSVLSSYPPGFSGDGRKAQKVTESNGARLCTCEFSTSDIERDIIRINAGSSYHGGEEVPTQIPFIAAGFFFAHANFLIDVPFDPLMPWLFMGEEIALSVRAWTSGWHIYAPRKNLIIHQYRPGRMGLPKFWEGVNRLYRGSGADNNSLQGRVVQRVKNLVGYADSSTEVLRDKNELFIIKEQNHYGMGNVRTLEEYMAWTGIDMEKKTCPHMKWCVAGELK